MASAVEDKEQCTLFYDKWHLSWNLKNKNEPNTRIMGIRTFLGKGKAARELREGQQAFLYEVCNKTRSKRQERLLDLWAMIRSLNFILNKCTANSSVWAGDCHGLVYVPKDCSGLLTNRMDCWMEEELKDYWNSQGKKWLLVWNKEMSVDIY